MATMCSLNTYIFESYLGFSLCTVHIQRVRSSSSVDRLQFQNHCVLYVRDFDTWHSTFRDCQCHENDEDFKPVSNRSMTWYSANRYFTNVIGKDLAHENFKSMLAPELISDRFATVMIYTNDKSQIAKTNRFKITIPPYLKHHFKSWLVYLLQAKKNYGNWRLVSDMNTSNTFYTVPILPPIT